MPLTERSVKAAKPEPKDYFLRDDQTRGFGLKVTPRGRKSFIAEGRIKGAGTKRITIGTYPALSVDQARREASKILADMQMGKDPKAEREAAMRANRSLSVVFEEFMAGKERKPSTVRDYRGCFRLVFADWAKRPIAAITKADVEKKFRMVLGMRGERTANKAFAILSGVCNWAMADDTITANPCIILKQKSLRRTPQRRQHYLSDEDIHRLIDFLYFERRSITADRSDLKAEMKKYGITEQGANFVKLLLFTGLRKTEALQLTWDTIDWEKAYLTVHDTKNGRDHFVPLSTSAMSTLKAQKAAIEERRSPYVFPSRYDGEKHMTEPKSQLKAICEATGLQFTLHDLRRTFATHASKLGVSHDMIKRALNHKSGDVTEGYIVPQIDAMRQVFEKVSEGFFEYAWPGLREELEQQKAADEALSAMPKKKQKNLVKQMEPAKFPNRGETRIIPPDGD
ncbi:tyrosine-type recombinase/integrase [Ovoidimarina sediminis]|uniref:tyrosine-type recombinase/integrase n=1 Tax=Ovoidimarina sediminis TaxID=3079856 RepID=UPI002906F470|nr:integrase family protein [Rhodophyticola sp. MJ-SS7]MDU8943490.1 integrase family protein [Rhodophyticola sp. MJ-SS7]